MAEPIKITQEELDGFNKTKEDIQRVLFGLGELYLEKMELDHLFSELAEKEKGLRDKITAIKKEELELMDKMLAKYGEGSLSLTNGMFIPSK